jgi:hypothetical protein
MSHSVRVGHALSDGNDREIVSPEAELPRSLWRHLSELLAKAFQIVASVSSESKHIVANAFSSLVYHYHRAIKQRFRKFSLHIEILESQEFNARILGRWLVRKRCDPIREGFVQVEAFEVSIDRMEFIYELRLKKLDLYPALLQPLDPEAPDSRVRIYRTYENTIYSLVNKPVCAGRLRGVAMSAGLQRCVYVAVRGIQMFPTKDALKRCVFGMLAKGELPSKRLSDDFAVSYDYRSDPERRIPVGTAPLSEVDSQPLELSMARHPPILNRTVVES